MSEVEIYKTKRLSSRDGPDLVFHEEVCIEIKRTKKGMRLAKFPEIDTCAAGYDLSCALLSLSSFIRLDVRRLVKAFTHRLSDKERIRKQRLLSIVDIVSSKLDAPVPEFTWLAGALVRSVGVWTFTSSKTGTQTLSSDAELKIRNNSTNTPVICLAKFKTDTVGRPVGEVLEIDEIQVVDD